MYNLALVLEDDPDSAEKDPQRARHSYERAIDVGSAMVTNNLTFMLQHGADGGEKIHNQHDSSVQV